MSAGTSGSDAELRAERERDIALRLLPVTASLAGLCVGGLIMLQAARPEATNIFVADELIAFDAILFLSCVYLILWAARTSSPELARRLLRVVDVVFLFALTTLLIAGIYIVYWVF